MAYDLVTAKIRLGIPTEDTSKDDEINVCLDMALALAETYCDRGFMLMQEEQEVRGVEQNVLRTFRYPIKVVNSVKSVSPGANYDWSADQWTIFKKVGEIVLSGCISGTQVLVDYEGGYEVLPSDLEWALWNIFDAIWWSTPGMGIEAGESDNTGPGDVKSFWINGVRIEYASTTTASAAIANNSKEEVYGMLPLISISVLSKYRAESALSGG